MQHATAKVLGAFILGALLAGGISFAVAAPPGDTGNMQCPMQPRGAFMHGSMHGWHSGRMGGAGFAAIADIKGIERLYLLQGRRQDIAELYRDVLSKTQNPMLRNYAYRHLARAELQVSNTDQAIATLRQNLDENLTQLNQQTASGQ